MGGMGMGGMGGMGMMNPMMMGGMGGMGTGMGGMVSYLSSYILPLATLPLCHFAAFPYSHSSESSADSPQGYGRWTR